MTKQEHLAREWAKYYSENWPEVEVNGRPSELFEGAKAAVDFILDHTEPETMADTEWNDDEHHLAGATTRDGDKVAMLWNDTYNDCIVTCWGVYARDWLTPNGKRYELREVGEPEQPEHQATLVTEQDYENAPHGTAAEHEGISYIKLHSSAWWNIDGLIRSAEEMARIHRTVLRWGWGK